MRLGRSGRGEEEVAELGGEMEGVIVLEERERGLLESFRRQLYNLTGQERKGRRLRCLVLLTHASLQ